MAQKRARAPTRLDKLVEAVRQAKLGRGAGAAFGRQGWKELGAAFGKALPDTIQVDELGSLGNRVTPQEVFAAKNELSPRKALQMDMDK